MLVCFVAVFLILIGSFLCVHAKRDNFSKVYSHFYTWLGNALCGAGVIVLDLFLIVNIFQWWI